MATVVPIEGEFRLNFIANPALRSAERKIKINGMK